MITTAACFLKIRSISINHIWSVSHYPSNSKCIVPHLMSLDTRWGTFSYQLRNSIAQLIRYPFSVKWRFSLVQNPLIQMSHSLYRIVLTWYGCCPSVRPATGSGMNKAVWLQTGKRRVRIVRIPRRWIGKNGLKSRLKATRREGIPSNDIDLSPRTRQ